MKIVHTLFKTLKNRNFLYKVLNNKSNYCKSDAYFLLKSESFDILILIRKWIWEKLSKCTIIDEIYKAGRKKKSKSVLIIRLYH